MKKLFLLLFVTACLFGCKDNAPTEDATTAEVQTEEILEEEIEAESLENTVEEEEIESQIKSEIDFGYYKLIIYDYESYPSENSLSQDSIEINEEVGSNFENLWIEIIPNNPNDTFELYLARESKIMVYLDEETIETLPKWGKIYAFEKLSDSALFFRVGENIREEVRESLKYDFEEIKSEVLQFEGEYINESVMQADSINDLPLSVWISSVYIKIIQTNSGEQDEKILVSRGSWGC